jgi:hypothetical protein
VKSLGALLQHLVDLTANLRHRHRRRRSGYEPYICLLPHLYVVSYEINWNLYLNIIEAVLTFASALSLSSITLEL